jgi:predicted Zn finger-like uncharacterized protein
MWAEACNPCPLPYNPADFLQVPGRRLNPEEVFMLVQCPKCKTTYKVSDEALQGPAAAFRCSRCKHTFEMQLEEISYRPRPATTTPDTASELTFAFEPGADEARGKTEPAVKSAPPAEPRQEYTGAETAAASASLKSGEEEQPNAAAAALTEREPILSSPREGGDKVLSIAPYREQRASVMPFLTLFALLAVFSLFVFGFQKTHPEAAEGWFARIPLVGATVVRNNHLKNGVLLKSIETKFQLLQGNREALVLTGVAVNQNPIMIRNVQLAGQLFDQEGKQLERQTMWIGNAISLQILRGMSAQDVTDLQRLKPLKSFEIPPGDSVPFAIVFLRPSKSLEAAGCEVVSVEEA